MNTTSAVPLLTIHKDMSILSNLLRCWLAMPLVAGFLRCLLACRTIEQKEKSPVLTPPRTNLSVNRVPPIPTHPTRPKCVISIINCGAPCKLLI